MSVAGATAAPALRAAGSILTDCSAGEQGACRLNTVPTHAHDSAWSWGFPFVLRDAQLHNVFDANVLCSSRTVTGAQQTIQLSVQGKCWCDGPFGLPLSMPCSASNCIRRPPPARRQLCACIGVATLPSP